MSCQPGMPATVPRTAPCGHQLRWKNSRIASTTATTIPWRTPRKMTPPLATSEIATALRRTRHASARALRSVSENAATMTTAARAVCGRSASSELRNRRSSRTSPAPTRFVTWLLAPDCSATAVREPLVEIEKPWKSPAATFAVPMPIISWFGWTSSPRRAAKLVAVAIVSASETSVMPTAAIRSGATSLTFVQGTLGAGKPCGSAPTVLTPSSARPSAAVIAVAPTTATRMAGSRVVRRGRISSDGEDRRGPRAGSSRRSGRSPRRTA